MKFTISFIILAGLATADVILTNEDYNDIEAGEPFTITWADATGPVTITLKDGPADDLNTVSTITSGQTGDSFTWTPSESLPSATYALEISDGSSINYSPQFQVSGGAASGSSIVAVSTSSMSATSTASTSVVSSTASATASSASTSNTTSTASSGSSSSVTMSSNSSSITGSVSTSSATTTMTTTRTSSRTHSTTTGTPVETEVPGANGAQGVVVPLVAPLLVAVGAAFF